MYQKKDLNKENKYFYSHTFILIEISINTRARRSTTCMASVYCAPHEICRNILEFSISNASEAIMLMSLSKMFACFIRGTLWRNIEDFKRNSFIRGLYPDVLAEDVHSYIKFDINPHASEVRQLEFFFKSILQSGFLADTRIYNKTLNIFETILLVEKAKDVESFDPESVDPLIETLSNDSKFNGRALDEFLVNLICNRWVVDSKVVHLASRHYNEQRPFYFYFFHFGKLVNRLKLFNSKNLKRKLLIGRLMILVQLEWLTFIISPAAVSLIVKLPFSRFENFIIWQLIAAYFFNLMMSRNK